MAEGGVARRLGQQMRKVAREEAKEVSRQEIQEHEERQHPKIAPRDRSPITAEPFAQERLPDEIKARAVELVQRSGYTVQQAAIELDVPVFLLQRELADYAARLERSLYERAVGL